MWRWMRSSVVISSDVRARARVSAVVWKQATIMSVVAWAMIGASATVMASALATSECM